MKIYYTEEGPWFC